MAIHKQPLSSLPSVRQLRAFVAVYHTASVSAAAQELSLAQPAVTMLLRELETKLGLSLFTATPGRFTARMPRRAPSAMPSGRWRKWKDCRPR